MTSEEMKLILTKMDTLERAVVGVENNLSRVWQLVIDLKDEMRMAVWPGAPDTSRPALASEAEMDGQWGNPEVRKDPPRWKGDTHHGMRFSECSVDYLDEAAKFNDWLADRFDEEGKKDDKGRPMAYWKRKDAALARGWAARKRAGWTPTPKTTESEWPDDTPAF